MIRKVSELNVGDIIEIPNMRPSLAPTRGVVTKLLVRAGLMTVIDLMPWRDPERRPVNYTPYLYRDPDFEVEIIQAAP